jgi:hypothetical protein
MASDPLEEHDLAQERPEMVEQMRIEYVQWFEDVSRTRPDNYAPPRIHIGTEHENPVVLTRQDWRHIKGRAWAPNSNGYWELFAPASGKYDIKLRFPELQTGAKATLEVAGVRLNAEVPKGAAEYTFEAVSIGRGEMRLLAAITTSQETKGPWKVDVLRR